MRVGIDISPLTATRFGVGNYCYSLLHHLIRLAPDVAFKGLSSGVHSIVLDDLGRLIDCRHVPLPTRVLYAMWMALGHPKADRLLGGVDVYHATNFFLPPTATARRVVTIHDLTFLTRPDLCSPKVVAPFSKNVRRLASRADAVIACSESTRRDVMDQLGVDPQNVTVAPEGVAEGLRPVPRDEAAQHVAQVYGIRDPFLLFTGMLEPRKNVVGLIRAFASLIDEIPHQLVLVGAPGWGVDAINRTVDGLDLGSRVVRPGFVPDADLPSFYSAADAFVFPSFYEGFGLPILEAMTCGCPVIAADNSSMPEVVGDAGLLVAAESDETIAGAIREVLGDESLRERLVEQGKKQAAKFTWDRCARITLEVYRRVAGCSC